MPSLFDLFVIAALLLLDGIAALILFALGLHAFGVVRIGLLAGIALLAIATLRLLLAHGLLALVLIALCILACLLLACLGLFATLFGLGAVLVLVLFPLVAVGAIASVVLRAGSGRHAQHEGSAQCDGPEGLRAGAEFHVGTFAGRSGMLLAWVYLAAMAMNGF